ncbi:DUF1801 domain-containing protein [Pedobacter frigidisoli]|uniref:DUF1801 domain-containing protein n=1 Tax=Pedobacter frigidisoli TaxID=2530455 RepID=A0A4R0PB28_9SPHI|nr:DUF1801 domain-containing protein [Pedobacter frigidisoli]TCD12055.1 DUF1801 domain-containing protein [Pedobacter frigidisoli]
MAIKKNQVSGEDQVDEYMAILDHPYKAEIEKLRSIIINANSKLAERIKWNAPSFYYVKDFAAFNLRAKGFIQIIFIFYDGNMIEDSTLLQGNWKDRREARFYGLENIETKKTVLEQFINNWIALTEQTNNN